MSRIPVVSRKAMCSKTWAECESISRKHSRYFADIFWEDTMTGAVLPGTPGAR